MRVCVKHVQKVSGYVTKDGSWVRELLHPNQDPVQGFSVAHAELEAEAKTQPHYHQQAVEVYYILEGRGVLRLGDREYEVKPGIIALIPPNIVHSLRAKERIRLLCFSIPAYRHEDTVLCDR